MSRRLAEVVQAHRPPLTFCVLTGDQVKRSVMREISASGATTTINWYCDDHFNFGWFSRRWTPCFNWVVTTSLGVMPEYERLGMKNVIKSQWACNPFLYRKLDLPLKYDVTFVGARHGNRPQFIAALKAADINVQCWGAGWGSGRLSQDEMIAVFNQSRINLNFTNGAVPPTPLYQFRQRMKHTPLGAIDRSRVAGVVKRGIKQLRPSRSTTPGAVVSAAATEVEAPADPARLLPDGMLQIKGRTFEVPGCGGFLMTGNAENLTDYFINGKEAAIFENGAALIERIKYYLGHESERAGVAAAGHARTLADHTYFHRYRDIFAAAGLPAFNVADAVAGKIPLGTSEDVR
jgi:spore maturation protein CgeB